MREGWYSENDHNKSEMYYNLFGNLVEFISVDQPQKIRGRKRNICFINEANELTWEDFFQLNIRTTDKIIIDYNPSDEFHWIYDSLQPREDADFFVTTYRDNPYLEKELVDEIERLQAADDNYWRGYGLGQRGKVGSNALHIQRRLRHASHPHLRIQQYQGGAMVDAVIVGGTAGTGYFHEDQ